MVKRSIEQEIRNKNFGNRNGNYEMNAVVKNQGTKQRVQRILGDCWQWETIGQCVKGDNCSFRHDTKSSQSVARKFLFTNSKQLEPPIDLKHEKHFQEQKQLDPIIPEQANHPISVQCPER